MHGEAWIGERLSLLQTTLRPLLLSLSPFRIKRLQPLAAIIPSSETAGLCIPVRQPETLPYLT